MKIYRLKSDTTNYSSFIQAYNPDYENSIIGRAMENKWKSFSEYDDPVELILDSSDTGKESFQFDISTSLGPFVIFSEQAIKVLDFILKIRGDYFPIITESKMKEFIGYYPTKSLNNCLNLEASNCRRYGDDFVIYKPILIKENITDKYLFTIAEDISCIFVTENFRKLVVKAGLKGFDFSKEIIAL